MKCIFCGSEIKEGSLFCQNCGKEQQIVPDYNVFEDEYLKTLLEEEGRKDIEDAMTRKSQTSMDNKEKQNKEAEKKKKTIIIASIVAAVVLLGIVIGVVISMQKNKNASSFDYQFEQAKIAEQSGDDSEAIQYLEKAIALKNSSVEARELLAKLYMKEKAYDSVILNCKELIRLDSSNEFAYATLIDIYEKQGKTDEIVKLSKSVDSISILDLFANYMVTPPVFSLEAGTYDDFIELELSTKGVYNIYYTLDGKDPVKNGILYKEPIKIEEEGIVEIKAVCVNEKSVTSEVASNKYKLELKQPDMPNVSPDGGQFTAPSTVTVEVPEGCVAYYTWDGTTPSVASTMYSGPIDVPEGDNVLAVILINTKTEKTSGIYRGHFVFYNH